MIQITIPLDDESAARLQELARQRGETVEQTAQALLRATLPSSSSGAASSASALGTVQLTPDDPDGTQLIRRLAGSIPFWPGSEGKMTHTTNEEIDRILAEEAMNPHEDD